MKTTFSGRDRGSAPVKDRIGSIEQYGIEFIPEDERHSKPANLFTILFGGSLTFSLIIIGWFPISFGLSFWAAASAVVVGSAVGALLLAPMGLMGPRSGTNNPVSSGAYFGVAGRLIGSFLEATASLAFAALSIWTGGDALAGGLQAFFHIENANVPRLIAYAVLSIIVTFVSVLGHANMVAAQKFMIPTAGLAMLVGLVVYGRHFDPSYSGTGTYAFGSFGAMESGPSRSTLAQVSDALPRTGAKRRSKRRVPNDGQLVAAVPRAGIGQSTGSPAPRGVCGASCDGGRESTRSVAKAPMTAVSRT